MLQINYVQNTGGAFGIGQGKTIQVVIINTIILGIIIRFLIMQFNKMDKITKIVLGFILAGGISNLLDRIVRGFVVDYIDISQIFSFPIFNLADAYVVIGWLALVLITIKRTFKEIKEAKSNI